MAEYDGGVNVWARSVGELMAVSSFEKEEGNGK
jgi:hypothetical protein